MQKEYRGGARQGYESLTETMLLSMQDHMELAGHVDG